MAGRLMDSDPEQAYAHAQAASRRAARLGIVREAAGLAAYATGRFSEALADLRAARRINGSVEFWAVMADCERGMGRPQKALQMAGAPEAGRLDTENQVELRIVAAGARADLGQLDAAVVTLQSRELTSDSREPWAPRLRYAYADALLAVGRRDEAVLWFHKAAAVDNDGVTDADDRIAELEGTVFVDLLDEEDDRDRDGESPFTITDAGGAVDDSDDDDDSVDDDSVDDDSDDDDSDVHDESDDDEDVAE